MSGERLIFVLAVSLLFVGACKKSNNSNSDHPHTEHEKHQDTGEHTEEHGHHSDDEHEDRAGEGNSGHHHGGIHLADIMQSIAKRFSAIWFAGRAENNKMVDYQIVELREALEKVNEAEPTEHGVDVANRLNRDILPNIERLPNLVEKGKTKLFEKTYRAITQNCSSCHADTGCDFINVKIPEHNPYPNLDFSTSAK